MAADAVAATDRSDLLDRSGRGISEKDLALGRLARQPSEIPMRGWWSVLRRVWREAASDNISMSAASCGFFALLAMFPALSVLISLYGLAFDPASVERQLEVVREFLPPASYDLIAGRVHDLVATNNSKLGWRLGISVALALWSASAATKAMMTALNQSYEEEEKRGFLRFNAVALVSYSPAAAAAGVRAGRRRAPNGVAVGCRSSLPSRAGCPRSASPRTPRAAARHIRTAPPWQHPHSGRRQARRHV